jgi:hypothetical protein
MVHLNWGEKKDYLQKHGRIGKLPKIVHAPLQTQRDERNEQLLSSWEGGLVE